MLYVRVYYYQLINNKYNNKSTIPSTMSAVTRTYYRNIH